MIMPIYIYGNEILKNDCVNISSDYKDLELLINNMFETMYNANGIGIAAPQVGLSINLFVIDLSPLEEEKPTVRKIKKIFINPKIINEYGEELEYEEGCLSIPEVNDFVTRKNTIEIEYHDRYFNKIKEKVTGIEARVIQHEFDHLRGILFVDHLSAKRKNILNRKLKSIKEGKFQKRYDVHLCKK